MSEPDGSESERIEATRRKIHNAANVAAVLEMVRRELASATAKFPPMNSAHEGYGILAEEVDELWDEIKAKQGERRLDNLRAEAVQVAAMAVRFILDVCTPDNVQK